MSALHKRAATKGYSNLNYKLSYEDWPEGMIEAWVSKNRIAEMERQGWYCTPLATADAILMRGMEPEPLRQAYLPALYDKDDNPLYEDIKHINYAKLDIEKNKILTRAPVAHIPDVLFLCESPIEIDIVGGLFLSHYNRRVQVRFATGRKVIEDLKYMKDGRIFDGLWLHVFQQTWVGGYRPDFLIVATGQNDYMYPTGINHHRVFIVECDGKDFHKNKEKDRERDYYFSNRGFQIIRFSGSEIWRNAVACGEHIVQTVIKAMWQTEREKWRHTTEVVPFISFGQALEQTITAAEWRYYSNWKAKNRESDIASGLNISYELYGALIDNINSSLSSKFKNFNEFMKARVYNGSGFTSTIFDPGTEPEVMVDVTATSIPFKERKPRVVVKFVRPDKEANKKKLDFYKAINSVKVIIFVDVTTMRCGVWQRTNTDWTVSVAERDSVIKILQYRVNIPVNDFYQNTDLLK